jgi:hypothetical protein
MFHVSPCMNAVTWCLVFWAFVHVWSIHEKYGGIIYCHDIEYEWLMDADLESIPPTSCVNGHNPSTLRPLVLADARTTVDVQVPAG